MVVTELGRDVRARFVQLLKAEAPMVVKPLGRDVSARLVQPEKAESPMVATESGRVILVRLVQFEKAKAPMWVMSPLVFMVDICSLYSYQSGRFEVP